MPSGMAAWGHWHTLGEAERKRGKYVKWRNAPQENRKGGATDKGKPRFPAAVTEVLQPSLSCVHGLRLQVFCRRHMSSNGLPAIAPIGNGRARRLEDRPHMTAGNSRRSRFTLAVSCIRRHFRLTTETKKEKRIRRSWPFSTST